MRHICLRHLRNDLVLRIRHHSAVELVDRLADAGLITREPDAEDRRRVRLKLTEIAEARLAKLSASHLTEFSRLRPVLLELLGGPVG